MHIGANCSFHKFHKISNLPLMKRKTLTLGVLKLHTNPVFQCYKMLENHLIILTFANTVYANLISDASETRFMAQTKYISVKKMIK